MEVSNFNVETALIFRGFVDDHYVIDLDIEPRHHNVMGFVHGGVLCTLLDTAMARSFFYLRPDKRRTGATLEMKINFLRSTSSGRITAYGKLVNATRQTAYVEGFIENEAGQLVAKASATMMHLESKNTHSNRNTHATDRS